MIRLLVSRSKRGFSLVLCLSVWFARVAFGFAFVSGGGAIPQSTTRLVFSRSQRHNSKPSNQLGYSQLPREGLQSFHHQFTSPSCHLRSGPAMKRQSPHRLSASMKNNDNDGTPSADEHSESKDTSSASSSTTWLLSLCFPLWLVYISNQWSRFSINALVDFSTAAQPFSSMNVDVGFDQAQYGLLASVAFTSLFAVASLGAGYASDRLDRKALTLGSAVLWSVSTLGMSQAQSYPVVVAFRVLTGLACAFSTPTAYTLLKERVPESRQALASSLYGTGVALASALTALSILLDNQVGWRNTLTIIGTFGLVTALASVVLLPSDDTKMTSGLVTTPNQGSEAPRPSLLDEIGDIVSTDRVKWLYLASLLRFGSGLTIGIWGAPYFRLAFPDDQSSYAVLQASISAIGATASGLAGGALADWLSAPTSDATVDDGDRIGRRLWVPAVGSLVAAPAWFWAVQADQPFETAMLWLAVEYAVAECWFGPSISTLQATVRPGTGGTAQGIFTLTGAVGNVVPSILGFLYASAAAAGEAGAAGSTSIELSHLLATFVCFGYLSSAGCFAMAARATPPLDKVKQAL